MKKLISVSVLLSIFFCSGLYSQVLNTNLPGFKIVKSIEGGIIKTKTITVNETSAINYIPDEHEQTDFPNASNIRWSFTDPIAIGDICATSSNGLYQSVGWDLNSKRISVYDNNSSTPLWEYPANFNAYINYTSLSDDGNYLAAGTYHNILVFNRTNGNTPIMNFNLETLPDTGIAGPVDITSDGNFIISCASRTDSSWIFGFQRNSNNWVWRYRVGQTNNTGGASVQGVKISGNDSLVIVNTYLGVYVFKTYTGQLIWSGSVNPGSTSGTQFPQAISGNGNYIATINYSGQLRMYQWNGSTYNQTWMSVESGGWMTAADLSYDGTKIGAGTLNFLGGGNYDGKIKFYNTSSSTPLWTYSGCGDEVTCVSISKNGKILAASTWGDLGNTKYDLLVFKTGVLAPAPVFGVQSPGSFFWCSVSADGSTVVTSGKKVHARSFGNGGLLYNVFIDTNDVPLGISSNNQPAEFRLEQNYPNPFNPSTTINFSIPERSFVTMRVYDMTGKEVMQLVNNNYSAGIYSVDIDANNLSSGIYMYSIEAKTESGNILKDTKKLTLIK
ncbi:MAG: T9SS type A sorting domain-containing protein [Ignavibacteria bacterium]|nr:T9SS type A sorting domain-containing protein [Ignavibacteria bacterium]